MASLGARNGAGDPWPMFGRSGWRQLVRRVAGAIQICFQLLLELAAAGN